MKLYRLCCFLVTAVVLVSSEARAQVFDVLWLGGLGTGTSAQAMLSGDMDGDGRTGIFHPWSNNGTLGLIVYRSTGTGYTTAFASANMGAGSPAVAWRTGDAWNLGWLVGSFDGGPRESLLHLFPLDGASTLIVYGLK